MTEKELLYYEEATQHEESIIKILNDSIKRVESEEIKNFLEQELEIHTTLKENLISLLEEKVNG